MSSRRQLELTEDARGATNYDSATSLATQFRDTLQLVVDNESQEGRPLVSTDSTCISVITVRDVTYYAALDTQA
ncbi:hypothetical protein LENED_004719 [Lentinula edodes]|uniref:Uncharacterized protein n=1 Tax=Lentinula edodes TaxID=5353 RepID=A0A1Q3E727_LENED|nr:hypothetical protein LENED_004719 [Lentinula edodes]